MADSDSSIAWHRAQIKRLKATLLDFEAGNAAPGKRDVRNIAGAIKTGQGKNAIADLKRKLRQSEQTIEAYERLHVRRPRGTDSQSLAGVRGT